MKKKKQERSSGCILGLIGLAIFLLLAIIKFIDYDNISWFILAIPAFMMFLGLGMDQSENEKKQDEKFKRSGMDPANFIDSGKYVSGHTSLNEPILNTFIYPRENDLKIYASNIGVKSFKAIIHLNKVKNISFEDQTTITKRVGLKRMLVLGLFAFAVKKKQKNEVAYVVIDWDDGNFNNETVFEFEGNGAIQRANTLRNKLISVFQSYKSSLQNTKTVQPPSNHIAAIELDDEVDYFYMNVVGERFKSERTNKTRQELISKMKYNDDVILEKDPGNPYDQNAIIVLNTKKEDVGYVPKKEQLELLPYLDNEEYKIRVKVSTIEEKHDGLNLRLKINIYRK